MKNDQFSQVQALFAAGDFGNALSLLDQLAAEEQWDGSIPLFRGIALQQLGDPVGAKVAYDKAINVGIKNSTIAWKNLAVMYSKQGQFGDAVGLLQSYREWLPEDRDAFQLLITALGEEGNFSDAEKPLLEWLEKQPDDSEAVALLQYVQQNTKRVLESLMLVGKARQGKSLPGPDLLPKVLSGLMTLGWVDVADHLVQHVNPDDEVLQSPVCMFLLAVLAFDQGDYPVAAARLQALLNSEQLLDRGRFNVAMMILALGNLELGWQLYHLRSLSEKLIWDESVPRWRGEDLTGKTVLVFSEQGAGDVIQFVRFIPLLEERNIRCVFVAYEDIVGLLRASPDAEVRSGFDLQTVVFDYQLQLMDLALVCGVRQAADIPACVPYLHAEPVKLASWAKRLEALKGLKVGLVWSGNPGYGKDHYRSASLFDLAGLAAVPGVSWVSLQKGETAGERGPDGLNLLRLGGELSDFGDTAAAMANLDLIITVDTAVAHLAGAMNKEVWVLLPKLGKDWRWFLEETTSPWYPSARLFTQEEAGDWDGLIRQVVRPALCQRVLDQQQGVETIALSPWISKLLEELSHYPSEANGGFDATTLSQLIPADEVAEALVYALALAVHDKDGALLLALCGRAGVAGKVAWAEHQIRAGDERQVGMATLLELQQAGHQLAAGTLAALLHALLDAGELDSAKAVLKAAERDFEEHRYIRFQAGVLAEKSGNQALAIRKFKSALDASPRYIDAQVKLYELHRGTAGQVALGHLERAIMMAPKRADLMRIVARELREANCTWLGEMIIDHLCEAGDPSGLARLTKADYLASAGGYEEARALLERAGPPAKEDQAVFKTLQASVFFALEDWDAYIREMKELVQQEPGVTNHAFALSWTLLALGRMQEGWEYYVRGLESKPKTKIPVWDGVEHAGAALLVYQDQGQGDLLQFCCLVRRLPPSMRVTLAVQGSVRKFLQTQSLGCRIIGIDEIDWDGEAYDFQTRQMFLPKLLGLDLLAPAEGYPYFHANQAQLPAWRFSTAQDERFKVGLVWAGNPAYGNDAFRSTMLKDWLPLLQVEGLSFYNLQKDVASNQAFGLPQFEFKNIVADCNSWEKTAAAVSMLDLVISVDSGVMHLAAGLGIETWGLLPFRGTDFRWLKEREDCPWYPSLRLFRQGRHEEWQDVLQRVATRLVETKPGLRWRT